MVRPRLSAVLVFFLLHGGVARAMPLDKDDCNKLKDEQGQLEKSGVRDSLAKGPQWAKGNLASDKLEAVRRLIEVDEQLLFRCAAKPLVVLPLEVESPSMAGEDKASPKREGRVVPEVDGKKANGSEAPAAPAPDQSASNPSLAPKRMTAPKTATKSAPKTVPKTTPKTAVKSTPKIAAPAKSQPKVDDAYHPPDGAAGANPFATQSGPAAAK
jgi:hypothetical protein